MQANFWKLLNNANFGFDCRDNSQNKILHLTYDEQAEIEFIKKYEGYESTNCFLNLQNMIENVQKKYANIGLTENERPFAQSLMKERIQKVTGTFGKRKVKKCVTLKTVSRRRSDKSYAFVHNLEEDGVNSVRGIACKKQTTVKVSTTFIPSKLLINATISLASFIYNCIDTFCFPNEETQKICSTSLEFIVVADKTCDLGETEMREVLLKIILDNDIHKRLDLSSKFFERFGKRSESIRK